MADVGTILDHFTDRQLIRIRTNLGGTAARILAMHEAECPVSIWYVGTVEDSDQTDYFFKPRRRGDYAKEITA